MDLFDPTPTEPKKRRARTSGTYTRAGESGLPIVLSLKGEEWRDCPGHEANYMVSDLGRVRSKERVRPYKRSGREGDTMTIRARLLKQQTTEKGYKRVSLALGGGGGPSHKSEYVHKLVALAFIGAPVGDQDQVNHIDTDKSNNRPDNLEWCTAAENMAHAAEMDLIPPRYGVHNGRATLTDEDVLEIRRRARGAPRGTPVRLAEEFGTTRQAVYQIIAGTSWRHLLPEEERA